MSAYETWKTAYPLHAYAQLGDLKTIEENYAAYSQLLFQLDNEKWLWIHYACFEGHADLIQAILSKLDAAQVTQLITAPNHFGSTPLHLAVGTANVDCLKVLLSYVLTVGDMEKLNEDKQKPLDFVRIADTRQKEMRLLLEEKKAALVAAAAAAAQ